MKKFLCALLLISFSFMAFGCTNSQAEENEWLKNKVSTLEKENAELEAEISRLKAGSYKPQNTASNNSDFQFLLDNYESVNYEIYNIADELNSIVFLLESADNQNKVDAARLKLDSLQEEVYEFAEESGEVISYF